MSEHIKRVYSLYAWIYDGFFGKIFEPGRYAAFHMMNVKPNETILEVGLGTGLSLPLYPKSAHVIGIDISQEMLNKAEVKKQYYTLSNVTLYNMDASSMTFADNTFDKVIASHVITVVPDPLRILHEIKRVCKKDGEIFILNYAGCNNRLISRFEKFISPCRDKLGLGKHIDLDKLLRGAHLSIVHEQRVNFLGMCRLIKCKNNSVLI
ncbi:MAG: class I SAM-dependent methyltransferase [Candidatus Jettenia sp.]|uniref:Phosphatidylethanolamine N-methyltransferase n=1 Tax=Candidatus Jettenia caeni TaxID=247490 RepID=I3IN39_9BACT|nr:class I SAM-dependent methyltransferase [Candidatus Jettenia sp. AMX1]MBC6928017.1 class I SAM-dependent methyltransferase [Candidatus Jettenia sp.]WKZ14816.1 MAG: class I SAM-dependent methyltransferase [Candidatus Jettenia caeni]KAA0251117.1 MAG: class I SAM-dependent methyltransferase [Candidatus Jettenia sp. AMX1]MCE7879344.1 class I SAM-dependent methyltransferase [Candidatus Jettenia sp. AMX1]MCQ3927432.1 class I SAM-dependent methyltransferase [Candidatus Jettenia sp.]